MRDPLVPGPDHFENWCDRLGMIECIEDQKFGECEKLQAPYFRASMCSTDMYHLSPAVWWL